MKRKFLRPVLRSSNRGWSWHFLLNVYFSFHVPSNAVTLQEKRCQLVDSPRMQNQFWKLRMDFSSPPLWHNLTFTFGSATRRENAGDFSWIVSYRIVPCPASFIFRYIDHFEKVKHKAVPSPICFTPDTLHGFLCAQVCVTLAFWVTHGSFMCYMLPEFLTCLVIIL